MSTTEITIFERLDGRSISKQIAVVDGQIVADGSHCRFSTGTARRMEIPDLTTFAALIDDLPRGSAIALGSVVTTAAKNTNGVFDVVTSRRLRLIDSPPPTTITRSSQFLEYPSKPGFLLIDFDRKGAPAHILERLERAGGVWPLLCQLWPELADAAYVFRASTSSGLYNTETQEEFRGSGGGHYYLHVSDVGDSARSLRAMSDRLWFEGLGWIILGKTGAKLERCIVDVSVGSPERLVFEGAPVLVPPLAQKTRPAEVHEGTMIDTLQLLPDLNRAETAIVDQIKREAKDASETKAALLRAKSDTELAKKIAEKSGKPIDVVLRSVRARHAMVLLPEMPIELDDEELGVTTIGDLLVDPRKYEGETLADPLEGIQYGRGKAMIMVSAEGDLFIHSFAHGRMIYRCLEDYDTLTAAIKESSLEGRDLLQTMAARASRCHLTQADIESVAQCLATKSDFGIRLVKKTINEELSMRMERDREQQNRAARNGDKRPVIEAPAPDAPIGSIMELIDDILAKVSSEMPPFRNSEHHLSELVQRPVPGLHRLGCNSTVAAPATYFIQPCDDVRSSIVIERHVRVDNTVKKDAGTHHSSESRLPPPFLRAIASNHESTMPVATGIATLPMVGDSGRVITGRGLDRESGLIFRVPDWMAGAVSAAATTLEMAKAAYTWLCDEWLADVATDAMGKAVAISAALTLIERHLLDQRPAYIIAAGRRGGGKTTLANMLTCGVLGEMASASSWSSIEEERRKSLFSLGRAGVASVVFDNIQTGSNLSCPIVERMLTSRVLSDRVLGLSEHQTVPSTLVMFFTGNNITAVGDLASRTLQIRIEVDRADPENRPFQHADINDWTLNHRREILRALYTILMLDRDRTVEPKTRFKTWWSLVAQPIELIAGVDFGRYLREIEQQADSQSVGVCDLYRIMKTVWPANSTDAGPKFASRWVTAKEIADFMNFNSTDQDGTLTATTADAETLKEALAAATNRPLDHGINSKTVGKRLMALVGNTSEVSGATMTLRSRTTGNAGEYAVEIVANFADNGMDML